MPTKELDPLEKVFEVLLLASLDQNAAQYTVQLQAQENLGADRERKRPGSSRSSM